MSTSCLLFCAQVLPQAVGNDPLTAFSTSTSALTASAACLPASLVTSPQLSPRPPPVSPPHTHLYPYQTPAAASAEPFTNMLFVQPPRQSPLSPGQQQPYAETGAGPEADAASPRVSAASPRPPPQAQLVRSRSNRAVILQSSHAASMLRQPVKPPRLHSPRRAPNFVPEPEATTSPYENAYAAAPNGSMNEPYYANMSAALTAARHEGFSAPLSANAFNPAAAPVGGQMDVEVPVAPARHMQRPSALPTQAPQQIRVALVRSASVRSPSLSQTPHELSLLRSAHQRFPDVSNNLSLATSGADDSSEVPNRAELFTDQRTAGRQENDPSGGGSAGADAAFVRPMTRFTTLDEQLVESGLNMSDTFGSTLDPVSSSLKLAPDADSVSLNSILAPNLEVLSAFHVPEDIKDLLPPSTRSTKSPATAIAITPQRERSPVPKLRPNQLAAAAPVNQQSRRPSRPVRSHSVRETSPRAPFASQELLLQVASPKPVSVEHFAPLSLPPASFTFEDLPERRLVLQELNERFTNAGNQLGGDASQLEGQSPLAPRRLADEYNLQPLCAEHRHALEMMCSDGPPLANNETSLRRHASTPNVNASAADGTDASAPASARHSGPCPMCAARPSLPLDASVYNPHTQNVRGVKRYYGAHAAHFRQFVNFFEHFYSHPYTQLLGTRTTGFKQLIAQRNSTT